MVNKILKMCVDKGFLVDKEVLELLSKLDENKVCEVVEILSGLKVKEKIITRKLFDKYVEILEEEKGVVNNKDNVKLLSGLNIFSKKIEVVDFVGHFRARYKIIKNILEKKEFENLSSIRRIGMNNGVWTIIAMVSKKRITKNKNLLIEVEDLTGNSIVLVNKENSDLFRRAKELLLDDIVAFRVSGSNKILFANDIIYPDAILDKERYGEIDEYIAFSGDFHVGSKMFLEKNLLRFVAWLNGEVGDKRQRMIAKKVKYLFLTGDNIDGVGIYQGQENFLNIKSCKGQYRKLGEILRKIREDVQIVMCPGQHDAVWVGEPQIVISGKWAPDLYQMKNLFLVPNPALVEICGGFKILMYHGASINRFIDEIPVLRKPKVGSTLTDSKLKLVGADSRDSVVGNRKSEVGGGYKSPTRVVKEMLKRRHLAPVHGLMDYIPCKDKDPMVIDVIPDIIATADQHRAEIDSYNNILMIASSCWQARTPFEEKVGNMPEPCKVPLFNLKTREIKIIDFSDDEIKWAKGEDLVCKLRREE